MNVTKSNIMILVVAFVAISIKKVQSLGNHVPIFVYSRNHLIFRAGLGNNLQLLKGGNMNMDPPNAYGVLCTCCYATGATSSSSVGAKAEELKKQAAKTRLEAQKMELSLTLKKIADLEKKVSLLENPVEKTKYEDFNAQIKYLQKILSKENGL
uniref:Uncharacterized protein n=1 Tax=Leptocylindrus danicus TaxID=163516 RepID=A0A7S2KBE4_9STRA|mmetsp:Transcript_19974/g.29760  ORF Transcript_19974/g.29760 Transcript_19974/m.29760 type:complete len:154 (+) Transcript_19974:98-559(+)|eukprot:CAMPEP_0116021372 /NCGR_PEP_ID=MMETSP0321-20121206/10348_1 /TAXON_ID=163516 /ORGANISM="Leptocylindrus danicus var. danicus, Strain B650" /LENGTH=153 /DNA_ID=CAMNT_0003492231 /DNA_START=96 /DNA_END=557 /DNA_ORIENTATION=+